MFPASYNMSIINAQHGSWDRTPPIGYRVMVLNLNSDGLAQNYSVLAEGWLQPNGTVWGKWLYCACTCSETRVDPNLA
jgi:glucose/arabinose dehydrogenase